MVAWYLAGGTLSVVQADSTLNQDFRLWSAVFLTFPLSSSFIGYMEVAPRSGDDVSKLTQLVLRPAVGYKLTDQLSLWQGYAWYGNYQPRFTEENYVWQQLLYARKYPFVKVLIRPRLEERFIEHTDGVSVRSRTMLRGDFPFPHAPKWAIVVFDELFVNVTSVGNGPDSGFDENRFFLGMNRQFTEQFDMDFGYQMQAQNNRQPGLLNQINHAILLQIFINL